MDICLVLGGLALTPAAEFCIYMCTDLLGRHFLIIHDFLMLTSNKAPISRNGAREGLNGLRYRSFVHF